MGITINSLGVPGIGVAKQVAFGFVSADGNVTFRPAGGLVKQAKGYNAFNADDNRFITVGTIMAQHPTNLDYAPWIIGVTSAALTNVATTLTISAASAAILVIRSGASGTFTLTGPPTAAGVVATATVTYSAVNTVSGVVTITATGVAFIAGSIVSEVNYAIPSTFVSGDVGLQMRATGDLDWSRIPLAAIIRTNRLLNVPTDTSLLLYMQQQMSTLIGNKFVFMAG